MSGCRMESLCKVPTCTCAGYLNGESRAALRLAGVGQDMWKFTKNVQIGHSHDSSINDKSKPVWVRLSAEFTWQWRYSCKSGWIRCKPQEKKRIFAKAKRQLNFPVIFKLPIFKQICLLIVQIRTLVESKT